VTALESSTKVQLGGTRGGPDTPTVRQDRWWIQPVVTVAILTAFVIYSTWAAFQNKNYFVGANMGRDLISPFYSPCIGGSACLAPRPGSPGTGSWTLAGPAHLDLPVGLSTSRATTTDAATTARSGGRRRACAVADAHGSYSGETRFPLFMQNAHRYFFYAGSSSTCC
jgi:hypothetical protein